jgi:hypothetical protein
MDGESAVPYAVHRGQFTQGAHFSILKYYGDKRLYSELRTARVSV